MNSAERGYIISILSNYVTYKDILIKNKGKKSKYLTVIKKRVKAVEDTLKSTEELYQNFFKYRYIKGEPFLTVCNKIYVSQSFGYKIQKYFIDKVATKIGFVENEVR